MPHPRMIALTLTAALALPGSLVAQVVRNGPLPAPLPLFPPDNWWNVNISAAPVDSNSAAFISFIGVNRQLHPDFGGDSLDDPPPAIYGMPYISVPGTQPLMPVHWTTDWGESDDGFPGRPIGYPIPEEAKAQAKWIEGGHPGNSDPDETDGDRHMLIVDRDNRILYELYRTFWNPIANRWEADSGAIFSLDSNHRRPEGWTSADAAGLAILPGLLRYDEVFGADPIKHALRFTVRATNGYVYPGSHVAGSTSGALPMGTRLRLKASKDISGYAPEIRKIFQAMKTYGLIVADNGSDMYIQGTYDTRWDNGVLNPAFHSLKASDFEVIQRGWRPSTTTPSGPRDFHTVAPCRLLDTREPYGPAGGPALPPTMPRVIVATGRCGVPAGARALSLNVTVFNPGSSGNVRLFPGDQDGSISSTLNFSSGNTRANNTIIPLAASGSGALALQSSTANIHVVVDVTGYFL